MNVQLENIMLNLKPKKNNNNNTNNNELNLSGLNVTEVEEYNNGRVSPASEPRAPSPFQSFLQKAKEAKKKVSSIFIRPSSPMLSFNKLQDTPLHRLYEIYLQNPSPSILQMIKQEVKHLGYKNPIVQAARSYAEGVFENAAYTTEATAEKELVNALGGSTLSSGGRHTRKRKRSSRKRKSTRKQ